MKTAKEYIKKHCGDIRHLFSKQDQKWWFEAMESYAESIRQEEREKQRALGYSEGIIAGKKHTKSIAVLFAKQVLSIDPQHFDYQSEESYFEEWLSEKEEIK